MDINFDEVLSSGEYKEYLNEESTNALSELESLEAQRKVILSALSELRRSLHELEAQKSKVALQAATSGEGREWRTLQQKIVNFQSRIEMLSLAVDEITARIDNAQLVLLNALAQSLEDAVDDATETLLKAKRSFHENFLRTSPVKAAEEFEALLQARDYLIDLYKKLVEHHPTGDMPPLKTKEVDFFAPIYELRHLGETYEVALNEARTAIRKRRSRG